MVDPRPPKLGLPMEEVVVSESEEDQFFESLEEIASPSDSSDYSLEKDRTSLKFKGFEPPQVRMDFDAWKQVPQDSIRERRERLLREMGLISTRDQVTMGPAASANDQDKSPELQDSPTAKGDRSQTLVIERVKGNYGTVLRTSTASDASSGENNDGGNVKKENNEGSRRSSMSSDSIGRITNGSASPLAYQDYSLKVKNLDSGKEFVVNELSQDGNWSKLREIDTDREMTLEEFERSIGFCPTVQELMRRDGLAVVNEEHLAEEREGTVVNGEDDPDADLAAAKKKKNKHWYRHFKFSARYGNASIGNSFVNALGQSRSASDSDKSSRQSGGFEACPGMPQRIKVHTHKKVYKEFSALYMSQEFHAHEGSILVMKFSMDGRFLATAGEDRVINIWEVIESERNPREPSLPLEGEHRPSESFSTVGDALFVEDMFKKLKSAKLKGQKRNAKSHCVVLPPKVFQLSEKPLCTFYGHTDAILDLSWAQSQYLISASMDKTVRLWHLGRQTCLKIFHHKEYVTCTQFNPVDERYFISGSLDKKVRIWNINNGHVVDWAELREIVTAVCYTPDGKAGIVGTFNGKCRFYKISGNKLQYETQLNVGKKKKKSSGKITGFQFVPGDSQKVLITSADSRIRVVDGDAVIYKYKGGFQNLHSQTSAHFSPNGKHVICASEDSRVYISNYDVSLVPSKKHRKFTCFSYENFRAHDVSVAIPWSGLISRSPARTAIDSSPKRHNGKHPDFNEISLQNDSLSREAERHDFEVDGCHHHRKPHGHAVRHWEDSTGQHNPLTHPSSHSHSHSHSHSYWGTIQSACASPVHSDTVSTAHAFFPESLLKGSATWPEEKLPPSSIENLPKYHPSYEMQVTDTGDPNQGDPKENPAFAWGVVIVAASHNGEIRTFQNYGFPVRL